MHADGGMCCRMFALSDVVMASSPAEMTSQVFYTCPQILEMTSKLSNIAVVSFCESAGACGCARCWEQKEERQVG